MSELTSIASPTAALVTSFKSKADASAPAGNQSDAGAADPFGPAFIAPTPHLSGATLSAIKSTAQTTEISTPPLPTGYDHTGKGTSPGQQP
jgi:hypothetical protein